MDKESSIQILKILKEVADYIKENVRNEFDEMELTGSQGVLVGTLAHTDEMKIGELSEKMGLSNSTVSGIIDRLEGRGIVERIRGKEDRRVVYVRVTPEVKKKAKKHFAEIEKTMDSIIYEADPEEVNKIFEGLELLKKSLDKKNRGT